MVQRVFLESDWDDAHLARQARDQHAKALEQEGYFCRRLTLYRITDGMPVFVLEADQPEPDVKSKPTSRASQRERSPRSRSKSKR